MRDSLPGRGEDRFCPPIVPPDLALENGDFSDGK